MKIKNMGSNQTLVIFNDGIEIFFSYEQAVAGFIPGTGYVKTAKFWSKTTSGHINKYLAGLQESRTVEQSFLNTLK